MAETAADHLKDQRSWLDPWSILFLVEVLAFLMFKYGHLGLPNYWDEAWVYYPAVSAMAEAGPSLSPSAIPTDLSRGHPLLFHFLGGLWMDLFGISRMSGHAFALTIATALVCTTFLIGRRVQGNMVGWAAGTMVLVNETFLAQSALLLPEVMLALFALLTVWAFVERSMVWFVIAASGAALVKESGLVAVLAVLGWLVLRSIGACGQRQRDTLKWMALCLAPIAVLGLFLLLQKHINGWYLFPDHIGMITWNVQDIVYKLKLGYIAVCEAQGLEWATYAFGIVGTVLFYRKDWKSSLLVLFLFVTGIKVLFGRWSLGQEGALIVPLLCFCIILIVHIRRFASASGASGEVVAIGLLSVMGILLFTALNFFSDRYLLYAIPFFALMVMVFLHRVSSDLGKLPFALVSCILIGILAFHIGKDDRIGDTRLTYLKDIEVRKAMADELRAQDLFNVSLRCSFMDSVYLNDVTAGYIPGPQRFTGAHVLPQASDTLQLITSSDVPLPRMTDTLVRRSSGPAFSALIRLER